MPPSFQLDDYIYIVENSYIQDLSYKNFIHAFMTMPCLELASVNLAVPDAGFCIFGMKPAGSLDSIFCSIF